MMEELRSHYDLYDDKDSEKEMNERYEERKAEEVVEEMRTSWRRMISLPGLGKSAIASNSPSTLSTTPLLPPQQFLLYASIDTDI